MTQMLNLDSLGQTSKIAIIRRSILRAMLGIRLTDRKQTTGLRQVLDNRAFVVKLKWSFSGHSRRMKMEYQEDSASTWEYSMSGVNSKQVAYNREIWRKLGEGTKEEGELFEMY